MIAKLKAGLVPVVGAVSLMAALPAAAAPCLVAEDPFGDSLQPLIDIVDLSMETTGGELVTVVNFGTDVQLGSLLSDVVVIFSERRFVRAYLDAPGLYTFDYGSYASDGTTVTTTSEGDAEGSVSGTTVTITAPLAGVGISGTVEATAQSGQAVITGFDVTEPAPYAVGSSCSKSLQADLRSDAASGVAPFEAAFDASRSAGADLSAYRFDFGDGSEPLVSSSPYVTHVYAEAGVYEATVTPLNSLGQQGDVARQSVSVQAPASAAGALGFGFALIALLGLARRR